MSYKFIKYYTKNNVVEFKVYKNNLPSLGVKKDYIKYLYNIIIFNNNYAPDTTFNTTFNIDVLNNTYDIIECIEFECKELILKYISKNYIEELL